MNPHPFKVLAVDTGAQLILTPCPGSKAVALDASIVELQQAGTDLLLTLMFDEEMERNHLSSLASLCEDNQIAWLQLPIIDDAAPNEVFEKLWLQHSQSILDVIHQGGTIAIHCKGGIGRTGLVAGLILLTYGWPADKIIKKIQEISPKSLSIDLQLDFFYRYQQHLQSLKNLY
ncbi:MAG: dual specificity protein phosphatase family protein [Colwellia sp.]|nr:dual specificity protein phosphatase family protein [Colwellia sp.]NQY88522.1 dual specificity protein phosphatase family protein [Colwellia sp.]